MAIAKKEKDWQAESDAYTLSESELIMSDPARLKAAKAKVKELVKQREEDAEATRALADKLGITLSAADKMRNGDKKENA